MCGRFTIQYTWAEYYEALSLIAASSYYEWTKAEDGSKDPHNIHLPDNEPFFFAEMWAHNDNLNITSCTILTVAAAPEIKALHDRMPINLNASVWEAWLDTEIELANAEALLSNNRGSELVSYRVSRDANSSRAKGAQLTESLVTYVSELQSTLSNLKTSLFGMVKIMTFFFSFISNADTPPNIDWMVAS